MGDSPVADVPVVDWARAGRRLRSWALAIAVVLATGIPATWLIAGDPAFGEWVFGALVVLFVVELVVVGGSALRGMLRAGARGDRLARPDVSLLPARRRQVAAGGTSRSASDDTTDRA
ncbi:MAG: hypothetical protein R3249_03055 [Nitriliruptorales bacterium]|nr:hypothetical protein [Nitriliruptorales bacterium]